MYTYSPSDVSITFAGKSLEGFSDKDIVRINRESPLFTSKRAMDGSVCITKQKYSRWSVTVYLAQSSPSNDLLNGVQKLLFNSYIKEMSYLPLIIKDTSGNTMFFAKDVWIEQLPEINFGQDMSVREWVFMCNDVECIIGGNSEDLDNLTEALQAITTIQDGLAFSTSLIKSVGVGL